MADRKVKSGYSHPLTLLFAAGLLLLFGCGNEPSNFHHGVNQQVVDFPPQGRVVSKSEKPDALRILFIGNSVQYWHELPKVFASLVRQSEPQKPLRVGNVTGNNYSLRDHWDAGMAAEFIQHRGPWDYVVLQGKSRQQWDDSNTQLVRLFIRLIEKTKAKPVLVENYVDDTELAEYESSHVRFVDMVQKWHIPVIPIGTCWSHVRNELPQIDLYDPDDRHHPSLQGTYLIALTLYGSLFKELPQKLPLQLDYQDARDGTKVILADEEIARAIRTIVSRCLEQTKNELTPPMTRNFEIDLNDDMPDFDDAIKFVRNGSNYYMDAIDHMDKKKFSEAVASFCAADDFGLRTSDLLLRRAYCYRELAYPEYALIDYRRVAFRRVENVSVAQESTGYSGLADCYLHFGNPQLALTYANHALRLVPTDAVALANKAEALYGLGKFRECIEPFQQCMKSWKAFYDYNQNEAVALRYAFANAYEKTGESARAESEKKLALAYKQEISESARRLIDKWSKEFKYKKVGTRVTVFSKSSADTTKATFLDCFLNFISATFVPLPPDFKIQVFVLPDKNQFQEWIKKEFGDTRDLRGQSRYEYGSFFTYSDSGFGTFSHEAMHLVLHETFPWTEAWAEEGLPAFFEKLYGCAGKTGQEFRFGFQNPWRIEDLRNSIAQIDLARVVRYEMVNGAGNQSQHRLVAMFLHRHGKLRRYFELARRGYRDGYCTLFETAFGKKIEDIEPLWKEYLQSVAKRKPVVIETPNSEFFSRRSDYEAFLAKHRKILSQSW